MKTILITGATSGIGLASARLLAKNGFRILGIGRDAAKCESAKQAILNDAPTADVTFFTADLLQQREVNRVSAEITNFLDAQSGGELFALVSNAGCARSWYTTTEEGYEQQFALNHLSGFLLAYHMLPYLLRSKGRVLITGSESHKHMKIRWDDIMFQRGYHPLLAYKQSKLCNLLFAKALNDRYGWQGLHAYAVDPGLVKTEIGCKNTGGIVKFVWERRKRHGVLPDVPAETYAFLCSAEPAAEDLYYHLCRKQTYSGEVNWENAARLFHLSERLCGVRYDERMQRK